LLAALWLDQLESFSSTAKPSAGLSPNPPTHPPPHPTTHPPPTQIILWDPSNDTLRPVLVLGQARSAVRSLGVIGEMGLLVAAHASGKVRGGGRPLG